MSNNNQLFALNNENLTDSNRGLKSNQKRSFFSQNPLSEFKITADENNDLNSIKTRKNSNLIKPSKTSSIQNIEKKFSSPIRIKTYQSEEYNVYGENGNYSQFANSEKSKNAWVNKPFEIISLVSKFITILKKRSLNFAIKNLNQKFLENINDLTCFIKIKNNSIPQWQTLIHRYTVVSKVNKFLFVFFRIILFYFK